jgi:hypothetical protein
MSDLARLLEEQLLLQQESFGLDPRQLEGVDRAEFVRWNVLALEDELHEAMQEIRWKPWVDESIRGEWVDRDAFMCELVDAFHFLMNLMLVAESAKLARNRVPASSAARYIADEFYERYMVKRVTNARRQAEGYTGEKDADGRELDRPELTAAQVEHLRRQNGTG